MPLARGAREYDVDREVIDAAMADCQSAEDPTDRRVAEAYLREALVPRRVRLLSRFNELSLGVKFLVDLRA